MLIMHSTVKEIPVKRWRKTRAGGFFYSTASTGFIKLEDERPFYKGMYFINGVNTFYKDDPKGYWASPSAKPITRVVKNAIKFR